MYASALIETKSDITLSRQNYCAAALAVSTYKKTVKSGVWGENGGSIFRVGNDMYFVPTQQVANDEIFITCDAQKIEGEIDGWRSRLNLGDAAANDVEHAIIRHLHALSRIDKGNAFAVTSDGTTVRL